MNELLVALDRRCHFVERNLLQFLPVLHYIQNLVDFGPEVWIWRQQMSHQILHFLRMLPFCVSDVSVHYTQLPFLLERVVVIVEYKQNAAQHPDIYSIVDGILEVEIDHLWRPVHQSCVFFESLLIMVHFGFRNLFKVDSLCTAAAEITQLSLPIFGQQNVLYFYILMEYSQLVHFLESHHSLFEDSQYLCFGERFLLFVIVSNQVIDCFVCQLHQNVALEIVVSLDFI